MREASGVSVPWNSEDSTEDGLRTDHHGLCWSRPASHERLDLNHSRTFLLPLPADPVTSEERRRWGHNGQAGGCVQSCSLLLTPSDSVRWLGLCQVAFGEKERKCCLRCRNPLLVVSDSKSLQRGRPGVGGLGPGPSSSPRCPSVDRLVPRLPPSLFSGRLPPNLLAALPSLSLTQRTLFASSAAGSPSHLSGCQSSIPGPLWFLFF